MSRAQAKTSLVSSGTKSMAQTTKALNYLTRWSSRKRLLLRGSSMHAESDRSTTGSSLLKSWNYTRAVSSSSWLTQVIKARPFSATRSRSASSSTSSSPNFSTRSAPQKNFFSQSTALATLALTTWPILTTINTSLKSKKENPSRSFSQIRARHSYNRYHCLSTGRRSCSMRSVTSHTRALTVSRTTWVWRMFMSTKLASKST